MSGVEELGRAVAAVAGACGGRVVGVGASQGEGCGLIIDDGQIITNAHNARDWQVTVTFADGRETTAWVNARDVDGDLTVLEVDTIHLGPIAWAEDAPQLGTPVVALANPGGRGLRATLGTVSGTDRSFRGPRGRRLTGAIEHTAPMGRGSSGGPLLDVHGDLLGLNTHRLGDGFYLAQPADDALRQRLDALAGGQAPETPRLGVTLTPDRTARRLRAAVGLPERDGALVHAVDAEGPAARAGLRHGDLLVAADGEALTGGDDLLEAVTARSPGDTVRWGVVRGADELDIDVALEAEPPG